MKKLAKNMAGILTRQDRETGIKGLDLLKAVPAVAIVIFLLAVLINWLGFAAGFSVTMITGLAIAAIYCFTIGE